MPFGQNQRQQQDDAKDKPREMSIRWDGSQARAFELQDWGRDDALLPILAVTPPSRNAAPGTPESRWLVRAKVAVSPQMGGGEQWVDVPEGATIRNEGTWVDPVLTITTPAASAATFEEEPHD